MPEVDVPVLENGDVDYAAFKGNPILERIRSDHDRIRNEQSERGKKYAELEKKFQGLEPYTTLGDFDTIKTQLARVTELEAKLQDAEGNNVMSKELEAQLKEAQDKLTAYSAFGSTDDLQTKLTDADYGRTRKREDFLSGAAKAAGFDAEAFLQLNGIRDLEIDYRDVERTVDGKTETTSVPHAKVNGKWTPLDKHVGEAYGKFMPILRPEAKKDDPKTPGVFLGSGRNGSNNPDLGNVENMTQAEYEKHRLQIHAQSRR
jgi:hypothetical protein